MAHGYTTDGGWFIDPQGRHTLLRGVNLSGATKVPYHPNGATHLGAPPTDPASATAVSFVGRPAPLDEVDRHLDRIAHWGCNVLRLLTTWEAIEHDGPGEYDEAYLDYYREVTRRAGERGLLVFVDPHHDVWSRWTGGDGAPIWAFDGVGLVPDRFVAADAVRIDAFDWPSNYDQVPVATMWTLFYGGDRFCPELAGVQEQLQSHYIGAVSALAERVRDLDNVLGYDSLNEPSGGYGGRDAVAMQRAARTFDRRDESVAPFSPLEYLAAADGVTVRHDDGGIVNPAGVSIWRDGCPWRRAGVWDLGADGAPVLANPTHFVGDGPPVRVWHDLMVPFVHRFRDALRVVHPDCIVFIEGSPTDFDVTWDDPDPLVVNARHWYDVTMLVTRQFDPEDYHPWLAAEPLHGVEDLAAYYGQQIGGFAEHSRTSMSDRPLLLGEFGVIYDLNGGALLDRGDYTALATAMEATYRAMDASFVHGTQWNYTPDNDHAHGDQWNDEDLSLYAREDEANAPDTYGDLDRGGRGIEGFSRPRVLHAAGRPTAMAFDAADGTFTLAVDSDPDVAAPTEVYVPRLHYPGGPVVEVSGGTATLDADAQRLTWRHAGIEGPVTLVLRRA